MAQVTFYPLGGLGEIGMNCALLDDGQSMLLIDCGLMFPEEYLFGIDVVIPRFDFVIANKDRLAGIVLTHGHEDHIGALPWLLPYVSAPVYGEAFTLALVENKLREHKLDRFVELRAVQAGERHAIGSYHVNFFPVCHSFINGFGLGIETAAGRLVHTGDFKIDRHPLHGQHTDLAAIERFAAPSDDNPEGCLCLFSDSTNVERSGFSLTEREIHISLRDIIGHAHGRVLITLFSSHIQRMQEIFDIADAFGRKVVVSGRSIANNIETSRNLGILDIAPGTLVDVYDTHKYKDDELILLVTGSQGEPLAALSRMAMGEHRHLRIKDGDLVLLSSRFIPGNTRAITRVINHLYKLGAEVLYDSVHEIHASGHAYREELELMLRTVRPRHFVPVHGEYRHLVKHARLARTCGVEHERAIVLEDGQPVTFYGGDEEGFRRQKQILVERIYVDGKGVGDVGEVVLKERQLLAGEGLVIVNMVIDEATGEITLGPQIISKGFVFEERYAHVLDDAKCVVLDIFENIPPGHTEKLKDRIRSSLRRFFRKVLGRDPLVVPVVISM